MSWRRSLAMLGVSAALGCGAGSISYEDVGDESEESTTDAGDGDGDTTDTGDGDTTDTTDTGDGDGDGDGDTTDTGDGDTTGGGSFNGDYLLAIETTLGPDVPLQFIATLDLDTGDGGLTWSGVMALQPLSLSVGSTTEPRLPVGEPLVYPDFTVTNENFAQELGLMQISGEANPVTGSDIEVEAEIFGAFMDPDRFCGEVQGMLLVPLQYDLAGSTFAAVRVLDTSPAGLPTVVASSCNDLEP